MTMCHYVDVLTVYPPNVDSLLITSRDSFTEK